MKIPFSPRALSYPAAAATGLLSLLLVGCATCPLRYGAKETDAFAPYGSPREAFRGFRQETFPATGWVLDNGVLRSLPGKSVDLITRDEFSDFILDLDWKVAKGANSGILYGVSESTTETYWSGPEFQINDDPHHPDGLTPKNSAGALYDLIPPNHKKRLNPTGQYNHTRIVSRGGHVEHWLNGAKILEYDWDSAEMKAMIQQSKFKDAPHFMKHRQGHVALQHHGDEVSFRNIRLRRLPPGHPKGRD